jgi:GTP cyclohydrolase II
MTPNGVTRLADAALPSRFGEFRVAVFGVDGVSAESPALIHGDLNHDPAPLVRLHSECLTGDVLGSLRCDCGEQLAASLDRIAEAGAGVLLYLRQEGRGIGLANKIRAYALQDGGLDTVDANLALGLPVDAREYASAAAILRHLGLRRVRLLTNNPAKLRALEQHGIAVVERVPLEVPPNSANRGYLRTKVARMGHFLEEAALGDAVDHRSNGADLPSAPRGAEQGEAR